MVHWKRVTILMSKHAVQLYGRRAIRLEHSPCVFRVFSIPELPTGRELSFLLIAPWDDPFYMGLNAIEIFTDQGTRADVETVTPSERTASTAQFRLSRMLNSRLASSQVCCSTKPARIRTRAGCGCARIGRKCNRSRSPYALRKHRQSQ